MDLSNLDIGQLAQTALNAALSHQWFLLVSLALFGAVLAVKKFLAQKVPFLTTDAGSALLTLLLSTIGAVVTAFLAPGAVASWALVLAVLKIAGAAQLKDYFLKYILPWVLLKLNLRSPTAAEATATAQSAGADAVKAAPAAGITGITGKVEEK